MKAEEVNLYDVWLLLTDAAAKIDRLYAALALKQESAPVQSVKPATQRVMEHPFFGMTESAPESVAETMAHLRGERYVFDTLVQIWSESRDEVNLCTR